MNSRHPANAAWESLLEVHATLMRRFAAEDIWQDLSMREYDVLYTLAKCPGPVRISDLDHHVLLSQPALSRMADRLAERSLIARQPDPADRRGVLLSLTEEGRARQREIGRQHGRGVARAMTEALDAEELRQLTGLLKKISGISQ
jgi:DNA-binding MarR family transcriptional regulator